jgi:hypothetical protein
MPSVSIYSGLQKGKQRDGEGGGSSCYLCDKKIHALENSNSKKSNFLFAYLRFSTILHLDDARFQPTHVHSSKPFDDELIAQHAAGIVKKS